ncbi:MAG: Gram-negative bacterial TonB protein C-terminal [Blastocatellia bacterium]|nr:Gram-negative bacterial TonB protein C-terminal [Blastocatellia bacterium]
MKLLKVVILSVLVLTLCAVTLLGKRQDKKRLFVDYNEGYVNEITVRNNTINAPLPVYPEEAIRDGAQGLVDVAVLFDENGNFQQLKRLESPHPALLKAVNDALKQWTVRVGYDSPSPATRLPVRMFGELRFHFVIRDGVGTVKNSTLEEQRTESAKYLKIIRPGDEKRPR